MGDDDAAGESEMRDARCTCREGLALSLPFDGDGVIECADGDLELDGFLFSLDWDQLDPPHGHPDGQEMRDAEAMADLCETLGLPAGAL